MKPDELSAYLRSLAARTARLPDDVQTVVSQEALRNPPRGVSVIVNRTSTGATVTLSGSGARAYSRTLRTKITARVTTLVRGIR